VDRTDCAFASLHLRSPRTLAVPGSSDPAGAHSSRRLPGNRCTCRKYHLDLYRPCSCEMENRITSIYERALTTTIDNIEHIESSSLNGIAIIKVYLQPQANVDGAIVEVIAEAQLL